MRLKVLLIGSGNVAHQLFVQWRIRDLYEIHLLSRSKPQRDWEGVHKVYADFNKISEEFDWAVIAVNDDAIEKVLSEKINTQIIVHTSGLVGMDVFKKSNFAQYGIFYPLQTFTKGRTLSFEDIPMILEASDEKTKDFLKARVLELGANFHLISDEEKKKLHLAAVFVSNYTNYMRKIGKDIIGEELYPLLYPLMKETLNKSIDLSPEKTQTGPAKRKDLKTIAAHESLLNSNEKELYSLMAKMIMKDADL